jgi:hypothetical protein
VYVTNIDHALQSRRSLEQALADLRAKYTREPSPDIERMIKGLESEIDGRQSPKPIIRQEPPI